MERLADPRTTDLDRRAWALQGVGRTAEARALWSAAADIHAGEREGPWRNRSRYLVLAGRTDEALSVLEHLADQGWSHVATLRDNVDYDTIRDHARFQRVYERVIDNARLRREGGWGRRTPDESRSVPGGDHAPPLDSPDPLSSP